MLGLMLQWGGVGVTGFLQQLDDLGFFSYVLPFLLLFAVVYALITRIAIFKENTGAAVLIAVAIGLLALQLNYVPAFFQNVFPDFGIGVAVLLIALILAGAFISEEQTAFKWIFFGIGMLIFLIITISSLSDWRFAGYPFWQQYGSLIVVVIVVIGAIVGVIIASKGKSGG